MYLYEMSTRILERYVATPQLSCDSFLRTSGNSESETLQGENRGVGNLYLRSHLSFVVHNRVGKLKFEQSGTGARAAK